MIDRKKSVDLMIGIKTLIIFNAHVRDYNADIARLSVFGNHKKKSQQYKYDAHTQASCIGGISKKKDHNDARHNVPSLASVKGYEFRGFPFKEYLPVIDILIFVFHESIKIY